MGLLTGSGVLLPASSALAAPARPSLRVAITDLPKGVRGDVVVTGPKRFYRKIRASATFTRLAPGTYRVKANPVKGARGVTYVPTVAGAVQRLAAGKRGTTKVGYRTRIPTTTKAVKPGSVLSVTGPEKSRTVVVQKAAAPKVGDVIAVGKGGRTPDGLLVKVTAVSRRETTAVLTTRPATLREAIPQGEFAFRPSGPLAPTAAVSGNGGVTAQAIPLKKNLSCGAQGSIGLTASVNASITPELNARWSWGRTSVTGAATAKLSADIEAKISGSAQCTLKPTPLGPPRALGAFTVPIGPVPVVIVPELQFSVLGSASAEAATTAKLGAGVTGRAGLTYDDGKLKPINSLKFETIAQPPNLTAGAKANLSLRAELTMSVYGGGGPTIALDPGLALNADIDEDPWWTLDATLGAAASLKIPKLGVSTPTVQLFNPPLRRRIAQAEPRPGSVVFSGEPGTSAPPANLGPYTMQPFGPDSRPLDELVTGVGGPTGPVQFSTPMTHCTTPTSSGCWQTWSHGYSGSVYAATSTEVTLTLPEGTKAFYFYAEPNAFDTYSISATTDDGTTSGMVPVEGRAGARYFGFYTNGSARLKTIKVTGLDPSGFAIGEFGIAK